jgi:hypothetical protein
VEDWVPVTSPERDPVKLVEEVAVVAVVAFPDRLAVMVPAAKLPEPSRETMVLGVEDDVAVVAELETLPEVEIVWSFESGMVASAMSEPTTWELVRSPRALECTTPVERDERVSEPVLSRTNLAAPETLRVIWLAEGALMPVFGSEPVNRIDGLEVEPAGRVIAPVKVPPESGRSPLS